MRGGGMKRKPTPYHELLCDLPAELQRAVCQAVARCRPRFTPRPYHSDWEEELYHEAALAAWQAYLAYNPTTGCSLYQWGARVIEQHLKRFCDRVWAKRISRLAPYMVSNSTLAYAPERSPLRYDKVKLMAFTEWIPPAPLSGLVRLLGVRGESFQSGQQLQPLRIDGQPPVGTLICVGSLFGWIARAHVREGAQWLCLMTAESSLENALVRRQYAAFTSLRAIETGRWIVRTSYNGGTVGFYGPLGECLAQQPNTTTVITGTIGLYAHQTPYVRFGDWWIYGCIVAISALIWRRSRQPRQ